MGIIRDILDQVDAAVDSVAQDGFISSAAAVGDVITAGAILLLILLGINVVMQLRPMTFGSADQRRRQRQCAKGALCRDFRSERH